MRGHRAGHRPADQPAADEGEGRPAAPRQQTEPAGEFDAAVRVGRADEGDDGLVNAASMLSVTGLNVREGEEATGYTGLNLHDWRGRSDGCITCPAWWIDAVLAACDTLAASADWSPRRHPDGRWCIGLLLEECR